MSKGSQGATKLPTPSTTTKLTMARMMLVGFFAGAFVSRPYMMATCISSSGGLDQGFLPPVPAASVPKVPVPLQPTDNLRGGDADPKEATLQVPQEIASELVVVETNSTAGNITRHHGIVIATKIHGPPHVPQLKQSLCLLNAAYNNRRHYDHVIFTTVPLSDYDTTHLQEIVHPASLRVVTDKQTLSDQINAMSKSQRAVLFDRCNATSREEIFWWTRCCEGSPGNKGTCGHYMPLAYSWQSEFRSKQIFLNSVLNDYKFMMWYDSDAMATRVWEQDPIDVAVKNELAIFFAHFPQGRSRGTDVADRVIEAYGTSLCSLKMRNGKLEAEYGDCKDIAVPQIHGFFHVTSLDFYRQPENLKWTNVMIGDTKFSRRWDDQLAVTVPPAMRAPDRAWEMGANGVVLDVWHNGQLDGKRNWKGGGFKKWWKVEAKENFPEAFDTCAALVVNSGR